MLNHWELQAIDRVKKCTAMHRELQNEIQTMLYDSPMDAAKKALGLD